MPHALSLLALTLLNVWLPLSLRAQSDDNNGTLYFPPKLSLDIKEVGDWYNSHSMTSDDGSMEDNQPRQILLNKGTDYYISNLLPRLFYEAGNARLPERYHLLFNSLETDVYNETPFFEEWDEITMYRDVLNILGFRMNRLPESTIALEGGYSTAPGEDESVANDRAEMVREYLMNIWKIEPERMTLLPPRLLCDSSANALLQEEAQTVIITPNIYALIEPVHYQSTGFYTSFVEFDILLQPNTETPNDVAAVEIVLRTDRDILSRTEVRGSPDSTLYRIQGMWKTDGESLAKSDILEVYALVYRWDGSTRKSNIITIPVKVDTSTNGEPYDYDESIASWDGSFFSVKIPFFTAGADTLSPFQQIMLDGILDRALNDSANGLEFLPTPTQHYVLDVEAEVEATETAGEANAELTMLRAEYQKLENHIQNFYAAMPEYGPIIISDIQSFRSMDYYTRVYGEQGEELSTAYNKQSLLGSILVMSNLIYPFLIRRENGVIRYLKNSSRGATFDSLHSQSTPDPPDPMEPIEEPEEPYEMYLDCYFTPEERFYSRTLTIYGYGIGEGHYHDYGKE